MKYSIQRLDGDDLSSMRALNALFADVFEDIDNYALTIPSDEYIVSFLRNENTIVMVAREDDAIIGGLVAYILVKFEMERKEIYLYDLAVSREHQRKGVGKSLIEQLKNTAQALGAYVVFVQADEGEEAVSFYESLDPDENLRTRTFDYRVSA